VLFLHDRIIQATGGSDGVRDPGGLLSALARPQAGFGDIELYPDLFDKAGALLHSLVLNHPFVDGNKRTGVAAAGIFLELNDVRLTAGQQALEDFAVSVATDSPDVPEIVEWLRRHATPGEPPS
jgi:death-on-curing protein